MKNRRSPHLPSVSIFGVLALAGSVVIASEKPAPHKTLHTSFFVYLEKGAWADRNLSSVDMGTRAGWTCKAGEIELSESAPSSLGEETRVYKSATVVCQAKNGSKIDMLAMCDIGYENTDGGSVRLYGSEGDFGVMTSKCRTAYW